MTPYPLSFPRRQADYYSGIISGENSVCLLAEVEGHAVGFLTGYVRETSSLRPVRLAELESMFVAGAFRWSLAAWVTLAAPDTGRRLFNYLLTFHIAGLTNEYAEPAVFIRDGKVVEVEPMTELEAVQFPEPIGTLEAFVTGGGLDTAPWTFEGRLRTLQNKTLRYPGHFAQLRAFYDLGLWDLTSIRVGKAEIVPRDVFHALFEPQVTFPGDEDMVIVRVKALGKKDGRDAEAVVELIDTFDEETGFTAMERGTGWSAAIVAEMMVRGQSPRGAGGVETFVPARPFVEELRRRGFSVTAQVTGRECLQRTNQVGHKAQARSNL